MLEVPRDAPADEMRLSEYSFFFSFFFLCLSSIKFSLFEGKDQIRKVFDQTVDIRLVRSH